MSLLSNTNNIKMQIYQQGNDNTYIQSNEEQEISEINDRQINYVVNLFILHGIFTSFEMNTKNL